jgi:elongation factor Ts
MADITAGMVKDLREKTGVGMMDCKAALAATNGDMEAAVDWLRAKGLAKAAKKSTRVAAEGLVGVTVAGTTGAVAEVNSETDFVARNEKFQAMVAEISKLALNAGGETEKLKTMKYPGTEHTVASFVAEMVATIGENMTVRRAAALSVKDGVIGSYVHNQIAPGMGKIGVLVALESTGKKEELASFGRLLAMHVAATNPVALTLDAVPADVLARERGILEEKNAGKPANVMEKIVASGLKTFAKENCLMEQAYVHDGAKTVTQVLGEVSKTAGADVKLLGFVRMQLGEGIDKKEDDFAAEVAKAAGTLAEQPTETVQVKTHTREIPSKQ